MQSNCDNVGKLGKENSLIWRIKRNRNLKLTNDSILGVQNYGRYQGVKYKNKEVDFSD